MTSDPSLIANLFADAKSSLDIHATAQKGFERMWLCSIGSISDADAARLLLETLGTEEEVKRWVHLHLSLTENVLKRWYMSARLQAHETKGTKE